VAPCGFGLWQFGSIAPLALDRQREVDAKAVASPRLSRSSSEIEE